MLNFEPLISVPEAAALLQIHEKTVQKMCRLGTLPAIRFGKCWKFRASMLDQWVKDQYSTETSHGAENGEIQ
jgi:excisionase family DNA binding protein